jgi:GTP-binding protein
MTSSVTLFALPFTTTAMRPAAGGMLLRARLGGGLDPADDVIYCGSNTPRPRAHEASHPEKSMHFVDECDLTVEAGDGGNGAIAWRREKYVPFGGPAGGDGGRGGDVVLVGHEGLGTLQDLVHQRTIRAERGEDGGTKDMYGRAGESVEVRVPLGTVVTDADTGAKLFEITAHGERVVAAKGGQGGRGNKHFATPVERAPRRAERGTPGQRYRLRLELKVMADVGLLGFPNAGKSTLISAVSRAHPKIADYPFTTLEPHLGVVTLDAGREDARTFVVADIPGLIEGASRGAGLGHRFLRHVERTRALLHLVTLTEDPGRNPLDDYKVLRRELSAFDAELLSRPEIVVLTKADLPDVREAYPALREAFAKEGVELHLVSAVSHHGLPDLMNAVFDVISRIPRPSAAPIA